MPRSKLKSVPHTALMVRPNSCRRTRAGAPRSRRAVSTRPSSVNRTRASRSVARRVAAPAGGAAASATITAAIAVAVYLMSFPKLVACAAEPRGAGGPPAPRGCGRFRRISRIDEDPEAAVAVASEDVGAAVVADERLHSPEVVALRRQIAPDFDELARAQVGRGVCRVIRRADGTLDLDRP